MGSEIALSGMVSPGVAADFAQPLEPVVEWLGILEQRGVDVSSMPTPSVAFFRHSLRFISPEQAADIVRDFLESARRFPTGREQGLPEKQRAVVRLRLQGFPYKGVAQELGLTGPGAHRRMKAALPFLEEATIERLDRLNGLSFQRPTAQEKEKIIALKREGLSLREIAGRLGRDKDLVGHVLHEVFSVEHFSKQQPDLERGREVVAAFWEEWNRLSLPTGVMEGIARRFKVQATTVALDLKRGGVDLSGEIKKKRLLFLLEVERTLEAPFRPTSRRLGVSSHTLAVYRRYVREGVSLRWATELARESKVDWWWTTPDGSRVNMGVRNRAILGNIEELDKSIGKHRNLLAFFDPNRKGNRGRVSVVDLHKKAERELQRFEERRREFLAQERAFRTRYQLPSMDVLRGDEI